MRGYSTILNPKSSVYHAAMITVLRTVIGTFCNLVFTALFAYVLSRKKYPVRTALTFFVVFTMWFNGGMIPTYLLIRDLHLMNKFAVYIIPNLINVWNLILMRNFFMAIPDELDESAVIDGATDPTILFRIYLPLSKASLATIALFYAVDHWNAWFDAVMYINNKSLWTLQMILREVINNAYNASQEVAMEAAKQPAQEQVQYATIVVATLPILVVYPFLQKYFVKGVMVGSLKG